MRPCVCAGWDDDGIDDDIADMFLAGCEAEGGIMVQLNFPGFATHIRDEYDYIVVGSGAGGGPVAANLAKHGFTVLLLEAGGADEPIEYSVPAFYTLASEQADLSWQYYVQHYASKARQER